MRLIDADVLLGYVNKYDRGQPIGKALRAMLEKSPTVDAEPVVRCKDCFWYMIFECKNDGTPDKRYKPSWCELWRAEFPEDGYCSAGHKDKEK